jgi:hypothetical protein
MRYRAIPIELEAIRFDGMRIPDFAIGKTTPDATEPDLLVDTEEGVRLCKKGDYFLKTDEGKLLVRDAAIFERIFEPVD